MRSFVLPISGLLIALAGLAACGNSKPTATPLPVTTNPATPSVTTIPPRALTVCLGQEPASLFPVNNPSSSARAVLAAVYDGPIDTNSYSYQPVILKDLPSLANGDARLFQKSVYVGDEVVDATDTPVTLEVGIKVRPAGCRSDTCAVVYDGKSALQMDQMQATFHLLPGLTWSDGQPLTAQDSVYAYNMAADPSTGVSNYLVERTNSYEAAGATTVQWWGKPGYIDTTYVMNFWAPLPSHLWSQIPNDQLAVSVGPSRSPIGWGPYVIQEWVAGDHITLTKNPYYFRASEGLPKFTTLTFRFVPDPATAINDLISGSCDILDPSINLGGQVDSLRSMADKKQLQVLFATPPVMEQLAFGIRPAVYDNGYNVGYDRPDYLGDVRVRQAVAMCIDRQKVVDSVLSGLSKVPTTFVPADDPLYDSSATTYSYDVSAANALLEQAGWHDTDNNPITPRLAIGVHDVPNGTPLELTYITSSAAQRVQVSKIVADSLAQCGIKVNVKYLDQTVLYAAGPDGALFGRNFDLAEFAMGSTNTEPPCQWFTSTEIPNAANQWVGTNVSGYSNPDFDAACQAIQQSLSDEPAHAQAYQQAQTIFSGDLPVLPLYWRLEVAAARPDVCHFSLDPTASSALWNIDSIDSGISCGQ
ncbi:MAG: peptide ABC transporter substrate-binding protein [Anaerolineales bacterium]|jgi:peptide/nickel transport system substrate-binding protein